MNVDKMRHQLARMSEAAEQHERERWFASLTPEHRRRHDGTRAPSICGECFGKAIVAMQEENRRRSIETRAALARMAERGRSAREREAATR